MWLPDFTLGQFNVVLFDLDSTILDTGNYASRASEWILCQSTEHWSSILEDFMMTLVTMYHHEIAEIAQGGQFKRPSECVKSALISALAKFDIEPVNQILREGVDMFRRLHIEYARPTDGLVDVLERLQNNRTKMAVITNTFQGNARAILKNLDIEHYFSVIADSSDYNAFKPMPEPFEFAMVKLDVSKENALYVGDEFYADVVGASRAGLSVVWINNREDSLKENLEKYGVRPTFIINSFSELKELI